jgi:hypothetical protein
MTTKRPRLDDGASIIQRVVDETIVFGHDAIVRTKELKEPTRAVKAINAANLMNGAPPANAVLNAAAMLSIVTEVLAGVFARAAADLGDQIANTEYEVSSDSRKALFNAGYDATPATKRRKPKKAKRSAAATAAEGQTRTEAIRLGFEALGYVSSQTAPLGDVGRARAMCVIAGMLVRGSAEIGRLLKLQPKEMELLMECGTVAVEAHVAGVEALVQAMQAGSGFEPPPAAPKSDTGLN